MRQLNIVSTDQILDRKRWQQQTEQHHCLTCSSKTLFSRVSTRCQPSSYRRQEIPICFACHWSCLVHGWSEALEYARGKFIDVQSFLSPSLLHTLIYCFLLTRDGFWLQTCTSLDRFFFLFAACLLFIPNHLQWHTFVRIPTDVSLGKNLLRDPFLFTRALLRVSWVRVYSHVCRMIIEARWQPSEIILLVVIERSVSTVQHRAHTNSIGYSIGSICSGRYLLNSFLLHHHWIDPCLDEWNQSQVVIRYAFA